MIRLEHLAPAAEEGWWTLFELAEVRTESWVLVGGQMVCLLAAEHSISDKVRPTLDVDVVVDVRTQPAGTEWLAGWLMDRSFQLAGTDPAGIGHRFVRPAATGAGTVTLDVLAPEGLGMRTNTYTAAPARTIQVPGSVPAIQRSEVVEVTVRGMAGSERTGVVRRPSLLGAIIAKAVATKIAERQNPERDWQDAALLLAALPDPLAAAVECTRKDRERLVLLKPLEDRDHVGWANLDDEDFRRGASALGFLLGA